MKENKTMYRSAKASYTNEIIKRGFSIMPDPEKLKYIVRVKFSGDTTKAIEFSIDQYNKYISKLHHYFKGSTLNEYDRGQIEYLIIRAIQSTNNIKGLLELDWRYDVAPKSYKPYVISTI